jgi:hypothetical protein
VLAAAAALNVVVLLLDGRSALLAAVEKHVGNNQYCKNKKKYCCFVHNPQFAAKNGTIHLRTLYYAKVDILIEETNLSEAKVCPSRCKGVLKCCRPQFFVLFCGISLQNVTFLLTDVKFSMHLRADWILNSIFVVKNSNVIF